MVNNLQVEGETFYALHCILHETTLHDFKGFDRQYDAVRLTYFFISHYNI